MTVKIYQADALAGFAELETDSVDAVITDPPYCSGGISEASRTRAPGQGLRRETIQKFGWFTGDNMGTAGLVFLMRAVAVESFRVLKPTGSFLTFCDWRMFSALQPAIESAGFRFQSLVVWKKESMGLGRGFRHQHELILHFSAGSPEYHHKGTSDIIECQRVRAAQRKHQTEKPIQLLQTLISVVAPPGGIVVDPFCGSGSTLAAARAIGREAIGFEIDPENCETASRRCSTPWEGFAGNKTQPDLFSIIEQ